VALLLDFARRGSRIALRRVASGCMVRSGHVRSGQSTCVHPHRVKRLQHATPRLRSSCSSRAASVHAFSRCRLHRLRSLAQTADEPRGGVAACSVAPSAFAHRDRQGGILIFGGGSQICHSGWDRQEEAILGAGMRDGALGSA
jgi:hypothetical protein